MDPIFFILCTLSVVIEIIVYIDLKKFIKTHSDETVEQNYKGLKKRFAVLTAFPMIAVVLILILRFIS